MKKLEDIKADVSVWWYGVKWNAKRKFDSTVKWCEENKELAIAMIPVGIAVVRTVGKTVSSIDRKIDMKKEQDLQELYVYDHSLGMYHKLRRPLRPSEKIEIDRRRQDGESKIQILSSMGLLD